MKTSLCLIALVGANFVLASGCGSAQPENQTPAEPVSDIVQGVTIRDSYRWLENWDDPKVQAWSDAQNARTRAYLDSLSGRSDVKAELIRLISSTSPAFSDLHPRGDKIFARYSDPKFQQPMIVTIAAAADPASRKTVLDPNELDPSGLTAIDWYSPSPDGKLVAVSVSKNGSEDGTLHVYDRRFGERSGSTDPARPVSDSGWQRRLDRHQPSLLVYRPTGSCSCSISLE